MAGGSKPLPCFNDLDDPDDAALVIVDLVDVGVGDAHADRVKVHTLMPCALLVRADLSFSLLIIV